MTKKNRYLKPQTRKREREVGEKESDDSEK